MAPKGTDLNLDDPTLTGDPHIDRLKLIHALERAGVRELIPKLPAKEIRRRLRISATKRMGGRAVKEAVREWIERRMALLRLADRLVLHAGLRTPRKT